MDTVWQARAALCELMALAMRYPDDALASVWESGEFEAACREYADALALPIDVAAEKRSAVGAVGIEGGAYESSLRNASDDALALLSPLEQLRCEYTRLLIGMPHPVVWPYEGWWRAQDDGVQHLMFVNPSCTAVERFACNLGLGLPEGVKEPMDHLSYELELLQYLALQAAVEEGESVQAAGRFDGFAAGHVAWWVPRFAAELATQARHPLYVLVAGMLDAFAESLGHGKMD